MLKAYYKPWSLANYHLNKCLFHSKLFLEILIKGSIIIIIISLKIPYTPTKIDLSDSKERKNFQKLQFPMHSFSSLSDDKEFGSEVLYQCSKISGVSHSVTQGYKIKFSWCRLFQRIYWPIK